MSQKLNISRFLLFVLFWTGCQTIQFERPNIVTDSDWLVDGYTQNRSRSTSDGLALPLEVAWEYNAAAAFGPGSPLILNGVVLIGTNKGEVHSIELATGRKRGFKNFGDGIEAPLAISEGFMYVASAWGKRVLTAFDLKKATFLWKNGGTPIESGFVVTDGLIIAADVQGMVHAFDQKTGEEQWKIELGDRVSVQSSLLLIQNKGVFVVDDAGRASLLNILDGSVLWSRQLSGPVYEGASSIGSSIAVSTTRGTVEVLDSDDGSAKWIYHSTNSSVRFGATAISENLVVVGATDGVVRAFLVENGVEKWSTQLPDVVVAAPLIEKNVVYVGSLGRKLYAFDLQDGTTRWETTLKGRIKSAMAISEGGLLVLSEPRNVTYFKTAVGLKDASN